MNASPDHHLDLWPPHPPRLTSDGTECAATSTHWGRLHTCRVARGHTGPHWGATPVTDQWGTSHVVDTVWEAM